MQSRHGDIHKGVLLAVLTLHLCSGETPAVTAVSDAGDSSSSCQLKTSICLRLSLEHVTCQKEQYRAAEMGVSAVFLLI